jgi:hypothetical protein
MDWEKWTARLTATATALFSSQLRALVDKAEIPLGGELK